jgi:hypothetical protein
MPVVHGNLSDLIKEKQYINPQKSWEIIKEKIQVPNLDEFDSLITESLAETNIDLIELITSKLKIKTKIVQDTPSQILDKSKRLLDICMQYGATQYLSGPSGRNYLDEKIFLENGIKVSYFQGQDKSSIIGKISGLSETR